MFLVQPISVSSIYLCIVTGFSTFSIYSTLASWRGVFFNSEIGRNGSRLHRDRRFRKCMIWNKFKGCLRKTKQEGRPAIRGFRWLVSRNAKIFLLFYLESSPALRCANLTEEMMGNNGDVTVTNMLTTAALSRHSVMLHTFLTTVYT